MKLISTFFVTLVIHLSACPMSDTPYTAENWDTIAMVAALILGIFSPTKFRIWIIGATIGLIMTYMTYKYIFPVLWEVLT